ncbi:MAG: signal transduction histidine kinase [Rhodothermales bacterium]|jgi:signal transduction histidine kinase
MTDNPEQLRNRLQREQQARLQAEKLLEEKSDELYETLMQIQSSESLLKSALKSMAGGMLILTPLNEVVLSNDQVKKLYPSLARYFSRNSNLTGKFTEFINHPAYQSIRNQDSETERFELLNENNQTIAINVRRTDEGFLASTHLDVTDQIAGEDERRRLLVNLMRAQRMEAIGRMSGMIAHDFNNIIAAIKGYASFLADDLRESPDQFKSVQSIQSATSRAELMISQIIHFTSETSSPSNDVSIIPVLEDCLDLLIPTLFEAIDVHFDEPEEPIWVHGNETRLSQLLTNLLTNASRAMSDFGGRLAVVIKEHTDFDLDGIWPGQGEISAEKGCSIKKGTLVFNHPCVRVVISDTGNGMGPETLERIFDIHFTTRGASGGLGMSSVAEIIAEHNGGIRVTSVEECGTVVEFVIPSVTYPTLTAQPQTTGHSGASGGADVLLIDDDESVGEMLQLMLERSGISVDYFSNATVAMQEIMKDHSRWRVVISDQIMPSVKGSDILTMIRKHGINIPFLLCSAYGGAADSELRQMLKDDFLAKPVNMELLLKKVWQHL